MERVAYETSEYGTGWVVLDGEELVSIILPGGTQPDLPDSSPRVAERLVESLEQYYAGNAVYVPSNELADAAGSTDLQKMTYRVVASIRPGDTMSYGEVAAAAGRPKAARSVGSAMAHNPYPPLIPCHRVVASDGGLGGYSGGVEMKAGLLGMEREGREGSPGSA